MYIFLRLGSGPPLCNTPTATPPLCGAAGRASVIRVLAGGRITATPRVCIQIRGVSEVAVVAAGQGKTAARGVGFCRPSHRYSHSSCNTVHSFPYHLHHNWSRYTSQPRRLHYDWSRYTPQRPPHPPRGVSGVPLAFGSCDPRMRVAWKCLDRSKWS